LGGNQNVLLAVPEIKSFRITDQTDFIILGCDGIFDKLTNLDVIQSIWSVADETMGLDINEHCGKCADTIIRNCLSSGANDNLTCIFICFENFRKILYGGKNEGSYSLKRTKNIENIKYNMGALSNYQIKLKPDEYHSNNTNTNSFIPSNINHTKNNYSFGGVNNSFLKTNEYLNKLTISPNSVSPINFHLPVNPKSTKYQSNFGLKSYISNAEKRNNINRASFSKNTNNSNNITPIKKIINGSFNLSKIKNSVDNLRFRISKVKENSIEENSLPCISNFKK
jgi:hypothetical protein